MKFVPHNYQEHCINRIIDTPKVGLFLDMGLGKTVITLTAIQRLKYDMWSLGKALVIAPKKVAEATWSKEKTKWDHLRDLTVSVVLGTTIQRVQALQKEADVYVINRDNVQWLVQYYNDPAHRERRWPFDTVVLDESSSFKNHQAKRFKALRTVLPRVNRLIELTGTPAPHGLMDLWAQIYLLDGGQRLGRTISVYRDLFFLPDKRNAQVVFSYKLREGAAETIHRSISDICVSMKAEDYLTLPDCIMEEIPVVLDKAAKATYDRLERDMLLHLTDNGPDDKWITASSAGVLTNKLLQLCDGAVYDEAGQAVELHDCKVAAFIETVEQLQGQHALVFYNFQHDRERLLAALQSNFPHMRVRVYSGVQDETDWNEGRVDILLAHPASCAYGLNLQAGGYHVIWFGLTWSLELYQQANKRLHRQGQAHPVIVHHLVVQDGVDEDVMRSLTLKDKDQSMLLQALKARLDKARR